jgi:hypothetical protein
MSNNGQPTGLKLPVKPLINPLTDADLAALNQVIAKFEQIDDLLARAQHAGMDVSGHLAQHETHKEIARRLKEAFFPDHLPDVT